MSSPVDISFSSFIKIDRRKDEAVYMQIVYQFINAVKRSILEVGDQIPGSRKIAEELGVHRKTAIAALEELQEQGWVSILPNIGSFVSNPDRSSQDSPNISSFRHPPEKAPFYFRKEIILDNPTPEVPEKHYFTDGTPDYRIIEPSELVRFYASVVKRKKNATDLDSAEGNLFFREQLSYYLNLSRGFHLSRNFLLPITGREQVFSILSRLLIRKGDVVLVENPSYFLSNMIFSQAGAKIKTVAVDREGMNVDDIERSFKPGEIRFVYLNARCQYPTTVSLSEKRKDELLLLAERYDFIIIEDDVDFEFSVMKNKKDSLFKKNGGSRVIYMGVFGRFLNPGFQMNFLIGPKDLLEEAKKYLNIFGKPNFMLENALAEIIHEGDIMRYQRKSNKIISERKDAFERWLRTFFADEIIFDLPASGPAFWIRFKDPISLVHLQKKAREKGLLIPSICLYQNRNITALRLGFAHLNLQDMEETLGLLHQAYREAVASII